MLPIELRALPVMLMLLTASLTYLLLFSGFKLWQYLETTKDYKLFNRSIKETIQTITALMDEFHEE